MRRNNGNGSWVSPSKEGIRRRLFPSSPSKSTLISPFPDTNENHHHYSYYYYSLTTKQGLISLGCFILAVLLIIHAYLFHAIIQNSNKQQEEHHQHRHYLPGTKQSESHFHLQHNFSQNYRNDHQHQYKFESDSHHRHVTSNDALQPPLTNSIRIRRRVTQAMYKENEVVVPLHVLSSVDSTRTPTSSPSTQQLQQELLQKTQENPNLVLEPLRPIDLEQYTIRINTWKRPEQLVVSVDHHSSCPGVAQIQIVWCDPDLEPPAELFNYTKVVIERHSVNTLNERFNILTSDTPTLGILSIDDDVLRPCEAIDNGFYKWTQSPDRMVGFDGRLHVENPDGKWQYGYMSTTEKANRYSLSLTRYCFLHRNYMDWYMNKLPATILDTVAKNFNCEDIAMSFMISSMTDGKPSLLADFWAIKSMVKLYVEKKISGGHDHKKLRDECVNNFAQLLQLKEGGANRLKTAKYIHSKEPYFSGGDVPTTVIQQPKTVRQIALESMTQQWKSQGKETAKKELQRLMSKAGYRAYRQGLIEKSDPWKQRFRKGR